MYGDIFEKTFNKHRKLLGESLNIRELQSSDVQNSEYDDPNWTDKVDGWDIIAQNVDFEDTVSLEDFFKLDESTLKFTKQKDYKHKLRTNRKRGRTNNYIHHITSRFKTDFEKLPDNVKKLSEKYFKLFLQDPHDPRLRYHRLKGFTDLVAVNSGNYEGKTYRSVGRVEDDDNQRLNPGVKHIYWFFIGGHNQYDDLLPRLK